MSRPRSLRNSASFEPQKAMQKILDTIYLHREKDRLLSRMFQELPDKKVYSDYYQIITKPIALDNIQARLKKGGYTDFDEFVKDVAQIFHNAKFYNNKHSQVFQDAVTLENLLADELQQLQTRGYIETADIPDLGPIPPSSPISPHSDSPDNSSNSDSPSSSNSDSEPSDEEDEDAAAADDDEDEYNEKGVKIDSSATRSTRTRTRRTASLKLDSADGDEKKDDTARPEDDTPKPENEVPRKRKRGRPPKIDTPEEARIRSILRTVRKIKDTDGRQLFLEFEKLPDQELYPDYYKEIKRPIALDFITKKIKRRDYKRMETFVADMNLMFNNAKAYNADESQIFNDAVTLQKTLVKVAEEERKKADSEYINRGLAKEPALIEAGGVEGGTGKMQRIPVGGVEANGERYEIGDWVMLSNPNDAEKPIVAQIFKTWQTVKGDQWINVCWYYRPEQTVHRSSRIFYENEVFKSGQYRDHPASQILSRTFVQFITRYTRGRPKHWPATEKIWVCESRYNDLTKAFSKINQWRACVPEEVRFDEYELFPFERQRQYERFPSPLMALLRPEDKVVAEGDKVPEPVEMGSDNGPPTVGAIYRGDSPEPEKEPTPPPPPPQPVTRPVQRIDSLLPQPMPYKNPLNPGQQGYTPQYRPLPPQQQQQQRYPSQPMRQQQPSQPAAPTEQPLAFTMPIAVPAEVAELVAKDNQGRVLWFGVPPVDIVGWSGGEGVKGHSVEYLAKKRKREEDKGEEMMDVQRGDGEDKVYKKRVTELLVRALGTIGK